MKLSTIQRKRNRVRNKIKKVSKNDRFRLSVSRSIKNISAQIIDDNKNITLLSASSNEKDIKSLNALAHPSLESAILITSSVLSNSTSGMVGRSLMYCLSTENPTPVPFIRM